MALALIPTAGEPAWSVGEEVSTGTIEFDPTAGRPLSSILSYRAQLIPAPDHPAEPLTLEQKIEFAALPAEKN